MVTGVRVSASPFASSASLKNKIQQDTSTLTDRKISPDTSARHEPLMSQSINLQQPIRAFVTGAAGFIGSNLTDRLLEGGHKVVGYDNLSTGRMEFLSHARRSSRFSFVMGDLLDVSSLKGAMDGSDVVFHLAANADVRFGPLHPWKDFEQNTIATYNVLETMRGLGINRIVFSSTGSVYGEANVFPTPEDAPFPVQTSLYGASKVSAEGLISAYSEAFGIQGIIFRFVSILGERYTHGHIFDFCKQLRAHPDRLCVLGNGKQRKSYLYVQDCINAIFIGLNRATNPLQICNLGTDEYCEVRDSVRWICEELNLHPETIYGRLDRGWVGDNPFIFLDCRMARSLGWVPKLNIREGVKQTVRYLMANPHLFECR